MNECPCKGRMPNCFLCGGSLSFDRVPPPVRANLPPGPRQHQWGAGGICTHCQGRQSDPPDACRDKWYTAGYYMTKRALAPIAKLADKILEREHAAEVWAGVEVKCRGCGYGPVINAQPVDLRNDLDCLTCTACGQPMAAVTKVRANDGEWVGRLRYEHIKATGND